MSKTFTVIVEENPIESKKIMISRSLYVGGKDYTLYLSQYFTGPPAEEITFDIPRQYPESADVVSLELNGSILTLRGLSSGIANLVVSVKYKGFTWSHWFEVTVIDDGSGENPDEPGKSGRRKSGQRKSGRRQFRRLLSLP